MTIIARANIIRWEVYYHDNPKRISSDGFTDPICLSVVLGLWLDENETGDSVPLGTEEINEIEHLLYLAFEKNDASFLCEVFAYDRWLERTQDECINMFETMLRLDHAL